MNIDGIVESTGLHEGSVTSMQLQNGHFIAQIGDIAIDMDGKERYVVAVAMDVQTVTRDGVIVKTLHMEAEASSVIQFERSSSSAVLIVDWRDYAAGKSETHAYHFEFTNFDIQVGK